MHDEKTSRGYPLPHPENYLNEDAERLRVALDMINDEFFKLEDWGGEISSALQNLSTRDTDLAEAILAAAERVGKTEDNVTALKNVDSNIETELSNIQKSLVALPTSNADPTKIFANPTSDQWGIRAVVFGGSGTSPEAGKTPLWELYGASGNQWYNVLTWGARDRLTQIAVQAFQGQQRMFLRCRHIDNGNMSLWQPWREILTLGMTKADDGKVFCVELDANGVPYLSLKKVGGSQMRSEIFASPGTHTWTVPERVTEVFVTMCGGGGGGSMNNSGSYTGAGGGAAACILRKRINVTPLNPLSVIVGSGGKSNGIYGGDAGGTSSLGALVSSAGGGGAGPSYGKGYDGYMTGLIAKAGIAGGAGGFDGSTNTATVAGLGGKNILALMSLEIGGIIFDGKWQFGIGGSGGVGAAAGVGADGVVILEYI